jgi:hypothetical protein
MLKMRERWVDIGENEAYVALGNQLRLMLHELGGLAVTRVVGLATGRPPNTPEAHDINIVNGKPSMEFTMWTDADGHRRWIAESAPRWGQWGEKNRGIAVELWPHVTKDDAVKGLRKLADTVDEWWQEPRQPEPATRAEACEALAFWAAMFGTRAQELAADDRR